MKGPCKDCNERYYGCHDHCIAYRKWHAETLAAKAKLKDDLQASKESEHDSLRRRVYG